MCGLVVFYRLYPHSDTDDSSFSLCLRIPSPLYPHSYIYPCSIICPAVFLQAGVPECVTHICDVPHLTILIPDPPSPSYPLSLPLPLSVTHSCFTYSQYSNLDTHLP